VRRTSQWQVHNPVVWPLHTDVKLKVTAMNGAGNRLLDTATESGSLKGLVILGPSSGDGTGLRILDIALKDAILVSLVILGLCSGGWFDSSSLGDNPGRQWYGACRSCQVPSMKKDTQVIPIPSLHRAPTLTSQHADTSSN